MEKLLLADEDVESLPFRTLHTSPGTIITFLGGQNGMTEVGRLEWPDGVMVFIGDADESAHLFFDHVLKPLVDQYIDNRLTCSA
jgi:hypothetical protein